MHPFGDTIMNELKQAKKEFDKQFEKTLKSSRQVRDIIREQLYNPTDWELEKDKQIENDTDDLLMAKYDEEKDLIDLHTYGNK
jgi:hypothetical protein